MQVIPAGREEIPVDTCIAVTTPECFDLTEKCIGNLPAGECLDRMLTGYDSYNVTSPKGKRLGNVTLSPLTIRFPSGKVGVTEKTFSRQKGQDRIYWDIRRLIKMSVQPVRANPACKSGKMFFTIL